jgi:hypothetical protein
MDYKKLIIDGYDGQQTTPLVSYFKQQAQKAKRDEFVEYADFFYGCKVVVSDWKRRITIWCDIRTKDIDSRINYWKNFIADDDQWENRVISLGGTVFDYNRQRHQKEKLENPEQKIQEYEQAKEQCRYELHSVQINTDDYSYHQEERRSVLDDTPERPYITLEYNTLVAIENALLQAEQEIPKPEVAEQPETKANKEKTGEQQRIIDIDKLNPYFISTFKGMGNGIINHFDTMMEELKTNRTAKEFAQIAYLIYQSKQMNNRKPNTFADWYKIFCKNIGIEQVKGYKPNNLKNPSDAIKKLFNYL